MSYNSGSNRARNFKSKISKLLELLARLLPELYSTRTNYYYKSRSETTAFDQRYFQGRLNTNNSFTQPYITRKVHWYSSRRRARNSASPPSEFSWQHSPLCCKRGTKPLKNASVFGTKNLLVAIIGLQSPSKIALIKSCRLTSWFIKFIRLELHKLELDIRDARDKDTDLSYTIEEVISIARSMI